MPSYANEAELCMHFILLNKEEDLTAKNSTSASPLQRVGATPSHNCAIRLRQTKGQAARQAELEGKKKKCYTTL